MLTRSSGIALGLPYLVMYYYHYWRAPKRGDTGWRQKLSALVPIALIPAALLTYMFYLYLIKGSPLIFRVQEETIWHRQFTLPWDTVQLIMHAFSVKTTLIIADILDVTAVVLALLTLASGWTRIPWHYRLFALALVVISLSFPTLTGKNYKVQYKDDLNPVNLWFDVPNSLRSGTGGSVTVSDNIGANPDHQRFYRVVTPQQ